MTPLGSARSDAFATNHLYRVQGKHFGKAANFRLVG